MRLIALLGVLFVLASCSDSDTPENFGLSCYEADELIFWEFDFDKNIVIRNATIDFEYSITEVSPIKILFKASMYDYTYVLDRVNLTIEIIYSPDTTITLFKCKPPQV